MIVDNGNERTECVLDNSGGGQTMARFERSWKFDLNASPAQLWPFVANTDRFNLDMGLPPVLRIGPGPNGGQILQSGPWILRSVWEELPFDWEYPQHFGVERNYQRGPFTYLCVRATFEPNTNGGTVLIYCLTVEPRSRMLALVLPRVLEAMGTKMGQLFQRYDVAASAQRTASLMPIDARLASGARARIETIARQLAGQGVRPAHVQLLVNMLRTLSDTAAARIRPYELADAWQCDRREILELMLLATRAGLLDLRWDVLCPFCRGAKESAEKLRAISRTVHCDGCLVDFDADTADCIEAVFRPSESIRRLQVGEFCLGSPMRTPHIVWQKRIGPKGVEIVRAPRERGRYRVRCLGISDVNTMTIASDGASRETVGLLGQDTRVMPGATLRFENGFDEARVFVLERTQWNDTAATAADVTQLQRFRDLFYGDTLRPGQQLTLRNLTVGFTDLKGSTALYNEGPQETFRLVMDHFDVLQRMIAKHGGGIVKKIGDAVMFVFPRPLAALQAMLEAQEVLARGTERMRRPLTLKVGIHTSPIAIAASLPYAPETVDYFGPAVNFAARLEPQSSGEDVVISDAVATDHEVEAFLADTRSAVDVESFTTKLKGFGDQEFTLRRIRRKTAIIVVG